MSQAVIQKDSQIADFDKRQTPVCGFCSHVVNNSESQELYNQPLVSTNNFVVVPSLGSLVPGWVMIVPKRHTLSMAALNSDEKSELESLVPHIAHAITKAFGLEPTIFEHGASATNQLVGCGIDHAHLHLVPLHFCLSNAATEAGIWSLFERGTLNTVTKELDQISPSRPYMYVQSPGHPSLISQPCVQVSQFFRRTIANQLGLDGQKFDYRAEAFIENCSITIDKLSPLL